MEALPTVARGTFSYTSAYSMSEACERKFCLPVNGLQAPGFMCIDKYSDRPIY